MGTNKGVQTNQCGRWMVDGGCWMVDVDGRCECDAREIKK